MSFVKLPPFATRTIRSIKNIKKVNTSRHAMTKNMNLTQGNRAQYNFGESIYRIPLAPRRVTKIVWNSNIKLPSAQPLISTPIYNKCKR